MNEFYFEENPFKTVLEYIIKEAENKGILDKNKTLIIPSFGEEIKILSDTATSLGYKVLGVVFSNLNSEIMSQVIQGGTELVSVPSMMQSEDLILMAEDMKSEYGEDAYLINLMKEKNAVSAIFKNAKKMNFDFSSYDAVVLPLRYGFLTGLAKYIKMKDEELPVIGIKKTDTESDIFDSDYFDEVFDDENEVKNYKNPLFIRI